MRLQCRYSKQLGSRTAGRHGDAMHGVFFVSYNFKFTQSHTGMYLLVQGRTRGTLIIVFSIESFGAVL